MKWFYNITLKSLSYGKIWRWIKLNNKLVKPIFLLILLMMVALTAGCVEETGPYKVVVEYNNDEGKVNLDDKIIESGYSEEYEPKTLLTIEALPSNGMFFKEWEGVPNAQKNQNPINLTVNKALNLKAIFTDRDLDAHTLVADFDQGSLDGWASANASLEVSKDFARSGEYSAKVVTLGSGWNRFEYNMADIFERGKTYQVTMWVYHEADEILDFHLATKIGDEFSWLDGNVPLPGGEWSEISATYEMEDDVGSELLLFLECNVEDLVYYVDDIIIKSI